jgi:saccharopine dehydrogenase (NADP+, L-glutamate forming)
MPTETPHHSESDTIFPKLKPSFRGTLRYQGFPEFVRVLVDIGFLSEETKDFLKPSDKPLSWAEATQKVLNASSNQESDLIWAISSKTKFTNNEEKERILAGLKWIGLVLLKSHHTAQYSFGHSVC